jgi:hypothetical protein
MILIALGTVSCAKADFDAPTKKLTVAKPIGYTENEQSVAADELDILDSYYNCNGCSVLEKMMVGYKKLRDKNRIARNEKLP